VQYHRQNLDLARIMGKILSPIKERVLEYIKYKGITKDFFCTETSISLSNFKGDGTKSELGGDKIVGILTMYSDINPEWLLTGKGDMLKVANESTGGAPINYSNIGSSGGNVVHIQGVPEKSVLKQEVDNQTATNILQLEIQHLKQELLYKDKALQDKDEIISTLKELINMYKASARQAAGSEGDNRINNSL
jgi:hypothetical protein